MKKMPPELASEVSSRMHAADALFRELWILDEVVLPGSEMERLMQAVWLMGYAEGMTDRIAGPDEERSPIVTWAEREFA